MKIIGQSWSFPDHIDGLAILKKIELIGRVSYKSEDLITSESAGKFVKMLIDRGHESVLEHASITVKVITDRGISHELVRHRIASYTQESTRFCNYSKGKFGSEITVIMPTLQPDELREWQSTMLCIEQSYKLLIEEGVSPQMARSVLPNSLKTELFITMNLRSWRHFFKLRTAKAAHPQMRELATGILKDFQDLIPVVFEDL